MKPPSYEDESICEPVSESICEPISESISKAVTSPAATVTEVKGDLTIVAPTSCSASVLLKLYDRKGDIDGPGELLFCWWMVAGRGELLASKVSYTHDNRTTIRIDVPRGVELSTAYLLEQLKAYWESLPTLPPDTPVIKG